MKEKDIDSNSQNVKIFNEKSENKNNNINNNIETNAYPTFKNKLKALLMNLKMKKEKI